ncbi:MAG: class I SAM-dependent methyltransferase [Candidatus Acidiferrales bacterium]|jgi:SAM-dependent methyltransferase
MASDTITHQREAAFHDAWAGSTPIDDVLVRECFEVPTALENHFILTRMGDLRGKRLLDIGAGLGESSVYFALQGAQVTMTDISPGMVQTGRELARRYGVEIEGIVSEAEDLGVAAESFDYVYIANTIHHVRDRDALFQKIHRALKLGGRFFSYDPLAYNPAINVYRRIATEVRTEDEAPLTVVDLRLARKYFPNVQHREFWISTLLLFVKYYAVNRVHPNQDRYWKRILRETHESLRWWMPLRALDAALTRLPLMRWMAWNMVMWGEKEASQVASSSR